ncbi:MAG: NAD(P)/FAD-dependent oxidoreductase [Fibrobacter sp.]|nr:NAD(P)/FAD-dependent oxidoreductase [Fibrobacter sp.]
MRFSKEIYDIAVIGAGPAGLNAGIQICRAGAGSLLLVDKTTPWEHPIACAEGVGRLGFEQAVDVKKEWIRQEINSACFHAPSGSSITYRDKNGGYIINRALMQSDMAEQIRAMGGECHFDCKVKSVSLYGNGARRLLFIDGTTVSARVVIDASGPVCGIGKGEKLAWKPSDLEPAYFVWAEEVEIESDLIHIYAGQKLAPGGYAWVFPRGSGSNIGIVLGKKFVGKYNIRSLLDEFIRKNFGSAKIVQRFAGAIPCGGKHGPFAVSGLIKAGDAASTINPISRAGISEALLSGKLAGEAALVMLGTASEREMRRICKNYEDSWNRIRGNRHIKLSRVKNSLLSVPDEDYNEGAALLSSIPLEQLTMSKIFAASLGRFPRLVWAMRHLM